MKKGSEGGRKGGNYCWCERGREGVKEGEWKEGGRDVRERWNEETVSDERETERNNKKEEKMEGRNIDELLEEGEGRRKEGRERNS